MTSTTKTNLDDFTRAYIECALWSSTCEPFGTCARCGAEDKVLYWNPETREHELCHVCVPKPLDSPYEPNCDANYGTEDLAPEALERIKADCAKFQRDNADSITYDNCNNSNREWGTSGQAGHDFWLTRNGHGAGFWDGDWREPAATVLDNASKAFGECSLYVGDDGKLYLE